MPPFKTLLALSLLAACFHSDKDDDDLSRTFFGSDGGGGTDDGGTDDTGSGGGTDCFVMVESTWPSGGTSDHYYLSSIEFELNSEDTTASLSLVDATGTEVPGSSRMSESGRTVLFDPTGGLSPSSSYVATVSMCGGLQEASISFATSALGSARSCDPEGRTYLFDPTTARIVAPQGVGELLLGQSKTQLIFGVSGMTAGKSMDLILGRTESGGTNQDHCVATQDLDGVDFSDDPTVNGGPVDLSLDLSGVALPIEEVMFGGTIASDCSYIGGIRVSHFMDARTMAPLLEDLLDTSDPDYVCQLIQGFGVTCEDCSSDGEPYCIDFELDSGVATEMSGEVECIAEEDCHPSCPNESATCDTSNYPTCD